MSLIIGLTGDVSGSSEYNLVYGVRHNYTNASPILERTGNMSLHKSLPIQSKMKRCVVRDDGTVNYYLHPNNSDLKEDGTAADLSGADGNVMVEIPDSYWYFHDDTVAKTYDIKCSLYPFPDCFLIPKRYVSAYWCTVNRNNNKAASVVNTTAAYRGCQNQSEWDGTYRSALGLSANAIGIPTIRTYTANIGPTWHCYDITTHQLIYWLYAVEYANLNWQADYSSTLTAEGYHKGGLGGGVSNITWDNWTTYNNNHAFIPCGFTNSLGNNSGIKTFTFSTEQANAYGTSYSVPVNSYRGIEIPFGYLWLPIEGYLGIGDGTYQSGYICRDVTKFASNLTNDYKFVGKQPKLDWNYGKDIIRNFRGDLFPISNGGGADSNAYFCDIFYNEVSNGTVYELFAGGYASNGSDAGPARLNSNLGFGWADARCSFRVISQKTNNV